jgi:signal transduction histidine kinase
MKRRGPGLGGWLLLLSSVLLAIPWLGARYIDEMKRFLLQGQEQAQLLAARAVATVLHERAELFDPAADAADALLDESALYVYPLDNAIQVDGYASDWEILLERARRFGEESTLFRSVAKQQTPLSFDLLLGERGAYLYALLRVDDARRVYRHPQYRRLDNSDHVRLALSDSSGDPRRYLIVTEGQGTISAYEVDDAWKHASRGQPVYGLQGVWQERTGGYDLELRMPLALLGPEKRLMFSVVDVDDDRNRKMETIVATLTGAAADRLNRLILRSPELERILQGLGRSDALICVVDRYRRVRAVSGSESRQDGLCAGAGTISNALVEQALGGEQRVVRINDAYEGDERIVASYPVRTGDQIMGAVLIEKDSAQILRLQRDTLYRIGLITFVVLLMVVAGLLTFAAWLAYRIRRLQREADNAIDADGRVLSTSLGAERRSADELGELSRSISGLLGRLQRYTGFLETIPRTLRHEILNPVNTISMTLQRLDHSRQRSAPLSNAMQAIRQLESIVNSLTEAASIEDALKQDDSAIFDMTALVSEYVSSCRLLHKDRCFVLDGPEYALLVAGSDIRIAQLLDKVKDNAVDFSPPGSTIVFNLRGVGAQVELTVENEGPQIPEHLLRGLFVGMVSARPDTQGKPHLGIGLFIAKRIALFHGGNLDVENRGEVSGVRVRLWLPVADTG